MTMRKTGRTLIHPVRMVAPCASERDLAERAFCTIIWSAHQYQMDAGVWPRRNPGHGMSEPTGDLSICQESYRGTPHVVLSLGLM